MGRLSEGRAKPLRLFALGESLGGGVVTTMCLLKPQLLDGAILIYPMLDVGKVYQPTRSSLAYNMLRRSSSLPNMCDKNVQL